MKKLSSLLILIFCLCIAISSCNTHKKTLTEAKPHDSRKADGGKNSTESASSSINWLSIEEAEKKNKKKPKKMLVDVYTDWCGWCKRMDAETFKNPLIAQYVNKNYYAVKLNAEGKTDIMHNGKTYKFVNKGRSGYHELAFEFLGGAMGFPSMAFLDEQTKVIQVMPGFKNVQDFDAVLNYFNTNSHKTQTFENYYATFKSKIGQ